jgi:hypothetical protein
MPAFSKVYLGRSKLDAPKFIPFVSEIAEHWSIKVVWSEEWKRRDGWNDTVYEVRGHGLGWEDLVMHPKPGTGHDHDSWGSNVFAREYLGATTKTWQEIDSFCKTYLRAHPKYGLVPVSGQANCQTFAQDFSAFLGCKCRSHQATGIKRGIDEIEKTSKKVATEAARHALSAGNSIEKGIKKIRLW